MDDILVKCFRQFLKGGIPMVNPEKKTDEIFSQYAIIKKIASNKTQLIDQQLTFN